MGPRLGKDADSKGCGAERLQLRQAPCNRSRRSQCFSLSGCCGCQLQAEEISEDDYFSRNPEFSSWLTAEKGHYFNSLTADESRELFAKFVTRWNAKKLPAKYYAGVAAPANMRRTGHDWGIRGMLQVLLMELQCFCCCLSSDPKFSGT